MSNTTRAPNSLLWHVHANGRAPTILTSKYVNFQRGTPAISLGYPFGNWPGDLHWNALPTRHCQISMKRCQTFCAALEVPCGTYSVYVPPLKESLYFALYFLQKPIAFPLYYALHFTKNLGISFVFCFVFSSKTLSISFVFHFAFSERPWHFLCILLCIFLESTSISFVFCFVLSL